MTPQRLLIVVGLPLGLLIAFLSPAWTAYDEFTHFARVVDMAQGNLEPTRSSEGIGSHIPAAYREATGQIILDHQEGRPPWSPTSIRALLDHRPDGRTTFIDTRPTTASTPVAYLSAAAGAWVPVVLDAPGLVVLWASRLASLAVYLAIATVAVRGASAFRWSLAASALAPLNLALASSVSPDGLTVVAVLLAFSIWTRVEAGDEVGVPALIGASLLLALAKPPYFLVLALFLVSAVLQPSRVRTRAALVAAGGLLVGLATAVTNSSENYQAVTTTMIQEINYQPGLQWDRLLGDLPGFLWATVDTWLTEYRFYVQGWFRQLGFWEADLPRVIPWALFVVAALALLRLDGGDLVRLRGARRVLMALGVGGFLVALYAASYVYFTDRTDYAHIGLQMARYAIPLAPLAVVSWLPRSGRMLSSRLSERAAALIIAGVPVVAVGASAMTWLWTGANTPLG
ncbi:MAG: DUF2142 domain-containing protein [Actinomycetota bacterium]|nr:DUF2142 domain-containing protein [Actinomycetota bacterium]